MDASFPASGSLVAITWPWPSGIRIFQWEISRYDDPRHIDGVSKKCVEIAGKSVSEPDSGRIGEDENICRRPGPCLLSFECLALFILLKNKERHGMNNTKLWGVIFALFLMLASAINAN
ncbi:MAG TPA: hypothetical protein VF427_05625, partial [Noviherbaspirillum sp.]